MVSPHPAIPDIAQPASLEARRIAIAAAFHAARTAPAPAAAPSEPAAPPAAAVPAPGRTEPAPGRTEPAPSPAAAVADGTGGPGRDTTAARLDTLTAEVRRLGERLTRVEDGLELVGGHDGEEPLQWPTAVGHDGDLGVPPLEVSRRSSPAFDVLLGPSR